MTFAHMRFAVLLLMVLFTPAVLIAHEANIAGEGGSE